ncbi:HpcH/HpaI aldolase family protein [Sinorhizobium mexicanum]|uniref:Aldolase n=1 Tax=Sinorhizobium mexicanum TaxID=375549 RepID=A0A859QD62_9HYPH|nr:aldolase/citrate lyase family protein [Sinorhizobium mexicanum]MBP1888182.1 2-keto-3-deoxy-L-rhamnonate aldolase RhmA [Sinorhizobium mexicanum]QLL62973.1 aldolase [Sinorhizobium mexicanum]
MQGPHIENAVLQRMRNDEVALGLVVRLARSGEIAAIAKASGHDFLFLDTQHALFSVETIGHIIQAALGCGIATIVRVPRYDDPDIAKFLDAGASGIAVADVATAEQARKVVEACRFPPLGKRSVQSTYSATRYGSYPIDALLQELERKTLVACMIETREGVANLDEICSVEGVDLIHLGCSDLLADMGRPGAFDDPELRAITDRLISVCREKKKFAGLGGDRDIARLSAFIQKGLRFHTTQTDVSYLIEAASRRAGMLREVLPGGRG